MSTSSSRDLTNCRTGCCVQPVNLCAIRLQGECVYYSGTKITGPGINMGDNFNLVVNKLTTYIDTQSHGSVTSVGLSMPAAFTVTNTPVTSTGTLTVTGAGTTAQYIRGDGTLATSPFPASFVPTAIPYADGSGILTSGSDLTWDSSLTKITIGGSTSSAAMSLVNSTSAVDDVISITGTANAFKRIRVTNSSNAISAGSGLLCTNDLGHNFSIAAEGSQNTTSGQDVAQIRAASFVNGLYIVASSGPISFGSAVQVGSSNEYARFVTGSGNLGLGIKTPTATIHIHASTIAAGSAPLKFATGVLLTTAETGAFEYNGTNLFFTRTGTTRENILVGNSGATAPSTTAAGTVTNRYGGATNFLGDPVSWASVVISGVTYKIPLYT